MAGVKTLFVGLDACDAELAQAFARDGDMPVLARLLQGAAVQPTEAPLGFLVGGNWPTITTGTTPSRHQFLCSGQVRGGTYEPRWIGPISDPPPVWQWVSRAGGRVAVLDAPHAAVADDLNGVQLVEWGCHDRHAGTRSFPATFLDDVDRRYGPHLVGTRPTPFAHFAPCDYAHRAGEHRTAGENAALLHDLLEGHRRKARLTCDLLREHDWELVFTVFGESHCAGHQFWKLHDPSHPWHDPEQLRRLGEDPLRTVYRALDRSLGELVDAAGTGATVYVLLSHGMRAHYDGTCLLDPVLWKLDEYASGLERRGRFTHAVDVAAGALPSNARRRALTSLIGLRQRLRWTVGPIGTDGCEVAIPSWIGRRRWWMQPNDSVSGSVRLNIEDREPHGKIAAGRAREVMLWLAERLLELVNTETAQPAVARVLFTDEHYERVPGDPMGDLIVEWNRDAPIDTVWSPATGVVTAPYGQWRTGDHHRGGLLLVQGEGVRPGRRAEAISVVDIAPTLAASLAVDAADVDGVVRADLVPRSGRVARPTPRLPRPLLHEHPRRTPGTRAYRRRAFDVGAGRWNEEHAVGLAGALHSDHLRLDAVHGELEALRDRVGSLERVASITQVTAWLRQLDVPESLLVSVVMPTRDRADLLERAVDSVCRQTYTNWELLIVDDASTDDTWARLVKLAENDARIRVFHFEEPQGSSSARNHALDELAGDVVAYLDDDNRFDHDWLRSLAWAFTEYPDTQVCYGARVVDDDVRHRGLTGRSMPFVQFLAWDREAMLQSNLVDQNTIAHRPGAVRFDPDISHFTDWDLLLRLTDRCDPLELPVVAVHYHSDLTDRLSTALRDPAFEHQMLDYVRGRTRERRGSNA